MTEFLPWLLVVEVIGVAFLPFTLWIFRWLPDRGYGLSKLVGLLGLTYVAWLVGSAVPIAGSPWLAWSILTVVGATGWIWYGRNSLSALSQIRTVVLIEEVFFLLVLVVWTILRAQVFHSGINHTEQYMDLTLLQSSIHSASYPPYDPWMSGHTVNYYYFGYLIFGTVTKLSGLAPAIGYNMALSLVFACTVSGLYCLGYAMTKRYGWALLAPVCVAFLGNWHAILVQIPNHVLPNSNWWFFESTRVVGNGNTINEFPFFSILLGDLHPHVMALPFTILAIGFGANFLLSPGRDLWSLSFSSISRFAATAIAVGALFTINSWDYPTFWLVLTGCLAIHAYLSDDRMEWWRAPALVAPTLGIAGVIFFLPFYLHFQSLARGLGFVSTRTDVWQFVQVFGLFLIPCGLLLASLAALLRPIEETEVVEPATGRSAFGLAEKGATDTSMVFTMLSVLAVLVLAAVFHVWVLLLVLLAGIGALLLLQRVLGTERPSRPDALALLLVTVACLVLVLTETVYIRDVFDGGDLYRMNSVFKFYYQAWTVLGLAGAYAVFRSRQILCRLVSRTFASFALILMALGLAGGGVYTVLAPQSSPDDGTRGLDGMAWLQRQYPGDYSAVLWLTAHAPPNAIELESTGDATHGSDYNAQVSRISTFTGLRTVMGWPGHEDQWRPGDGNVGQRVADVRTIYTSPNIRPAARLLHQYGVKYVIVGATEHLDFGSASTGLTKFGRFMRVAHQAVGTTIYTW